MLALFLRTRVRRIAALLGFALLFVIAGATARTLAGTEAGHVEMGELFLVGGYPLVSTLLLLGWLLGRYPMIATLALVAGLVSADRESGMSRLYSVRPTSLVGIYVRRFFAAAVIAFVLSAVLLPGFDLLMLGEWAGPATLVLIASYVAVYGSLCFLLSVWIRNDAWATLALALAAMVWQALLRAGTLADAPPGVREVIAVLLPPQSALFQLESAFGALQPIPWSAFAYVVIYASVLLAAAVISLRIREY
ncbi:MAG: hypothetical protein ACT443_05470 [Gemmatimonadota bacterium]